MRGRSELVGRMAKRLELTYVDSNRVLAQHDVSLVQMHEYETADGTYRVALRCRDAEGDGKLKDFLSHRIQKLTDLDTGEIAEEPSAFLAQLLRDSGGRQPRHWPSAEKHAIRTTTIDVDFGPDGFAVGWVFGVHQSFRAALDIECLAGSMRRPLWTQGIPPRYQFEVGDIFHSPAPWGPNTRHSIQVKTANDQELTISIMTVQDQRVVASRNMAITQKMLVDLLKNGLPQDCAEASPARVELEAADG